MKVRKAVKKIVALGVGATMLGATLLGATAADLNQFPGMFYDNEGNFDGLFVVGASADAPDIVGMNAVSMAVQASAVKKVWVPSGAGTTVEIEDGYLLSTSSNPLVLGENLAKARTTLRDTHLSILDDGEVRIGSSDYDYTQRLTLNDDREVLFGAVDNVPRVYVDLKETGRELWNYTFTIDELNAVELGESVSIEILGKKFTLDPNMKAADSEFIMYGAEKSTFLELGQQATVEVGDDSYVLEIVGANSDDPNIVLSVNGVKKTLEAGVTQTIAGLEVFVEDLFITNIPTLDASANVFVGSQKVEIQNIDGGGAFGRIKINGKTVSGVEASVDSIEEFTTLKVVFSPYNLRDDVDGFDRVEYLFAGDAVSDPLFDSFEVFFQGMTHDLMDEAKAHVLVEPSGDNFDVTFEDYYGNLVEFEPFLNDGGKVDFYGESDDDEEGFNVFDAAANILESSIFALNEIFGSDDGTKIYEVVRILEDLDDATKSEVELKNLATGNLRTYKLDDEIGDSGVTIDVINETEGIQLSKVTSSRIFLKGGQSYIDLSSNTTTGTLTIVEDPTYTDSKQFVLKLDHDDTDGTISSVTATDISPGNHKDNKETMYLSQLGSYAVYDTDNKEHFEAWISPDEDNEVTFNVFVAPKGAETTASGSGHWETTIVDIPQSASVLDTEVTNPTSNNLIMVGGPCVNSVVATIMGADPNNCAAGFVEGKAMIKLFDESDGMASGKVAMLIAGYNAADTRRATTVVSEWKNAEALYGMALEGMEVEVAGTSLTDISVGVPTEVEVEVEDEVEDDVEDDETEEVME